MPAKRIKFSSVKENQFGLSIGFFNSGEWENYFLNDKSLIPSVVKGEWADVEYKINSKGNMIITGITPDTGGSSMSGGRPSSTKTDIERESIQKQVCLKCATEIMVAMIQAGVHKDIDSVGVLTGAIGMKMYEEMWPPFRGPESPFDEVTDGDGIPIGFDAD